MAMMFGELRQPSVLVLGLGISGLAMARWCTRYGCRVRIADTRAVPSHFSTLQESGVPAEFVAGPFTPALLEDSAGEIQLIALSPGLSPLEPALATLLAAAHARGIPVWGELEFFAQALKALSIEEGYTPHVLALTGTNGKTTTTALTGLLCEGAGKRVTVAGNIGPAMLDKLADALDANNEANDLPEIWVIEASSFQLAATTTFAPSAAAILNLSPDHLDWHGDFAAYAAAKGHIFGPDTVRVLNRDDAEVMQFTPEEGGARCLSFGLDAPQRSGDYGLLNEHGMAWLTLVEESGPMLEGMSSRRSRAKAKEAQPVSLVYKRLMPADALRIRGRHNAMNALAALALCQAINLPLAKLLHSLREYRGEPHRFEFVASLNEVDFIDDSKGTNVGATLAALNSLTQKAVLILGGDGKGQDFTPLLEPITRACRAVVLLGRDAPLLRSTLAGGDVALYEQATLEEATRMAATLAQPGEMVLLSPACASLDMFRNYEHRAEVFRSMVHELAEASGMTL